MRGREAKNAGIFMRSGTEKRAVIKNGIGEEKVRGTGSSSWLVENQYKYDENKHNLRLRVENQDKKLRPELVLPLPESANECTAT